MNLKYKIKTKIQDGTLGTSRTLENAQKRLSFLYNDYMKESRCLKDNGEYEKAQRYEDFAKSLYIVQE